MMRASRRTSAKVTALSSSRKAGLSGQAAAVTSSQSSTLVSMLASSFPINVHNRLILSCFSRKNKTERVIFKKKVRMWRAVFPCADTWLCPGGLPLTHSGRKSTMETIINRRFAARRNGRALGIFAARFVRYCQKRAWKIVNIFPFSFMAHVVYFRKPRKKFRMWFRRILHLSCAMIVPVSSFRTRAVSPRKGGGVQRGGKEGHRCQREFKRCGTLSPPCW